MLTILTIRSHAIAVVRIVVVQRTRCVHITDIIRVARVGSAERVWQALPLQDGQTVLQYLSLSAFFQERIRLLSLMTSPVQ